LNDIGDELYALPPQSFTAARNTRVAEAKNAGDRAGAARLAALKRPTVGAWLVNLVALRRPESVAGLIEVGERLRAAQAAPAGGDDKATRLRELSTQRRRAIEAILADTRALAAEAGEPEPSAQHLAEAESTFAAALADEDAAQQVRSGRLLKALSYSGFGQPILGGVTAPTSTRTTEPSADQGPDLDARRAAASSRVDEAREALDRASETEREAAATADRLAEELTHARERHEQARAAAQAARQARMAAERELASMERRLARLT
jgi:hypothetical protein